MKKIWYDHEAKFWNEALPIGNGHIGGMVFSGSYQDRIQLNEDTLYSGAPIKEKRSHTKEEFDSIRELLDNGEYDKARLMIENAESDYHLWGTHIMDVVTNMCEKGEKEKAKKYLNKYSGNISDEYDNLGLDSYPLSGGGSSMLGDRKYVIKLINAEIANY